jgi:hypothetical protein
MSSVLSVISIISKFVLSSVIISIFIASKNGTLSKHYIYCLSLLLNVAIEPNTPGVTMLGVVVLNVVAPIFALGWIVIRTTGKSRDISKFNFDKERLESKCFNLGRFLAPRHSA